MTATLGTSTTPLSQLLSEQSTTQGTMIMQTATIRDPFSGTPPEPGSVGWLLERQDQRDLPRTTTWLEWRAAQPRTNLGGQPVDEGWIGTSFGIHEEVLGRFEVAAVRVLPDEGDHDGYGLVEIELVRP